MGDKHVKILEGDSWDYWIITNAIKAIPEDISGLSCEIGLRRGGGSKFIVDSIKNRKEKDRVLVAIDCYGGLPYKHKEKEVVFMDYTNDMRDQTIGLMHEYCYVAGVNFIFYNLTDSKFFQLFLNGVPVYNNGVEYNYYNYIFVHFDGPHDSESLLKEFDWFNRRMNVGSTIVLDDITYYDFDKVHRVILENGWIPHEYTKKKISYQKTCLASLNTA